MGYVSCRCHNGKCPACNGTGEKAFSKIRFGGEPLYCNTCHGTKQCQKCGGTERVWKDDPRPRREKRERTPRERNSRGSSKGYASGGGGGSESPGSGLGCLAVIGLIIIAAVCLINYLCNSFLEEQQKQAIYQQQAEIQRQQQIAQEERRIREDLPAGLHVGDENYIEFGTSSIGPFLIFDREPSPAVTYHVYTKPYNGSWREEEINPYTQRLSDGTYRVVMNPKNILSTMGGGRIILSWE